MTRAANSRIEHGARGSRWAALLALAAATASSFGCSMLPNSDVLQRSPDREFMQRVADDPFPNAAQQKISQ